MDDRRKTKEQLLEELQSLRRLEAPYRDLLRSETQYREVVEHQAELICRWLPNGRITFVNEAYCRYFSKGREELVGHSFMPLIPAEDQARVARHFASLTPQQPVATHEHRVIAPGGRIRWMQWTNRALFDDEAHLLGYQAVGRDVTERVLAEEALRTSEGEKALILSSVSEHVLFQDTGHRIVWANRAAADSVHTTPDRLVGRLCYTVWHPRTEPCTDCPVHKALETGQAEVAETQSEDGRYWLIKGYPVRDDAGNIVGAVEITLDITARRQAEEDRRRLEARVQQAQKLESLGILAGGIAHDFNNLLVGILGNVGLAATEAPSSSPLRPFLDRIETAALRARDLTSQLLAYSGKGKFIVRPVDLSGLVRETVELLHHHLSTKAALDLRLADHLPLVYGDVTQLRQIVMNLLTNASEAVGDAAGTITIATATVHADRPYLEAASLDDDLSEGLYVFLEVSDTGCGMDAEILQRIFDPFFTTKFSGRGLGLAAVLGIVRGHQGAIRVYSEPGRGTCVKVLLPVAEGAATEAPPPQPAVAEPAAPEAAQTGGTVLVIDDEESVRQVARLALRKAGFEVLVASSGREGLERFQRDPGRIAAVLLDMTMPDLSGEEVFDQLRRVRPGVPVILSSGYNEQDAIHRFTVGNGADRPADARALAGFIQKPYLPGDLVARVRAALGR